MSTYDKLTSVPDFDHDKGRELAELHTEMETLKRRLRFLEGIATRHTNLNQFLWRTYDGTYMLVHDMTDEHLKNAVKYTLENRGQIPPVLYAEYRKRFGEGLPEAKQTGQGHLLAQPRKRFSDWDDDEDVF